jgi:hypothetical protein
MRALALALVVFALPPLLGACKRREVPPTPEGALPVASSARPVDHLAPDELIEGDQKALGVPVPRGMAVDRAFADNVYVSGTVKQTALVQFLRERVRGGRQVENARTGEIVFDRVKVPAEPAKELQINVSGRGAFTRMEVRDVTLPSTVGAPSDEPGRWHAVGMTPNGKLADPTHLE